MCIFRFRYAGPRTKETWHSQCRRCCALNRLLTWTVLQLHFTSLFFVVFPYRSPLLCNSNTVFTNVSLPMSFGFGVPSCMPFSSLQTLSNDVRIHGLRMCSLWWLLIHSLMSHRRHILLRVDIASVRAPVNGRTLLALREELFRVVGRQSYSAE